MLTEQRIDGLPLVPGQRQMGGIPDWWRPAALKKT
ncbi:MAG: hypothetical protein ACI8P0_004038 [Planctomycetaceae bacterium]|jgi:hypothetical protein